MQFESVTAEAFGPFPAGAVLQLAAGMNVVWGHNEAGKSSWHAAIYLGLCGLRRGRGRRSSFVQMMEDKHAPWNGPSQWRVAVRLILDDGRDIEIRQDLALLTGLARDVHQGRDHTSEIEHDGAPDGSRWLGLDRDSFLATACVRQASIQQVLEEAGALQEYIQRAAATAGVDSTAESALRRIKRFRRDYVGLGRANSTKPLRMASVRLARARDLLGQARADNDALVTAEREARELARQVSEATRRVQIAQSVLAQQRAEETAGLFKRVARLADQYPVPPPDPNEGSELAERARAALLGWNEMPESIPLDTGRAAAELQRELDALPLMPTRETKPKEEVRAAHARYGEAQMRRRLHLDAKPQTPVMGLGGGLTSYELRSLAHRIEPGPPEMRREVSQRYESTLARVESQEVDPTTGLLRPRGLWARVADTLRTLIALLLRRPRPASRADREAALAEFREAEVAFHVEQARLEAVQRDYEEAVVQVQSSGLPAIPDRLLDLMVVVAGQEVLAEQLRRWETNLDELDRDLQDARASLSAALNGTGTEPLDDAELRFARYEAECAALRAQAERASQRPALGEALRARRALEAKAQEIVQQRQIALSRVKGVARAIGVEDEGPQAQADAALEWLEQFERERPAKRRAWAEWQELQALLEGTTREHLQQLAEATEETARRLSVGIAAGEIDEARAESIDEETVEQLRDAQRQIRDRHGILLGRIQTFKDSLPSVVEAEEELTAAEAELGRVRRLDYVLQTTERFLEMARDRIHRDLAPRLRAALRPAVPAITTGRYTDVQVDVESLRVRLLDPDGEWRDVSLLSHGTAEQIYLLLRVELAGRLTRRGETCPLILDDVTVQCDTNRTRAVLDLLHETSRKRQVILFSQEDEVAEWARAMLGERDRFVGLNLSENA